MAGRNSQVALQSSQLGPEEASVPTAKRGSLCKSSKLVSMPAWHRRLHTLRRSILERLLLRMNSMNFGYTYIERGSGGEVQNDTLKPFSSFEDCCAAAEAAANAASTRPVTLVQVLHCRYDSRQCVPEMRPILRTYERSEVVDQNRTDHAHQNEDLPATPGLRS